MNDLTKARRLIKECKETQNPYLDLGRCGITDLNDLLELFECTHLEILILSNNQIADYSFLKDLKQLQYLDLSFNKISDTSFLRELKQLQNLNLRYNQISDISFLKELKELQNLNLWNNNLKKIPKFIFQLGMEINMEQYGTSGLCLYGNPIVSPPMEIIKQGKSAVLRYFAGIEDEEISFDKEELLELKRTQEELKERKLKLEYLKEKLTRAESEDERNKLKAEIDEEEILIEKKEEENKQRIEGRESRGGEIEKKLTEALDSLTSANEGILAEIKRLKWIFHICVVLIILFLFVLSIVWISAYCKLSQDIPFQKFWMYISPSFILVGFIWAAIVQVNRAQRQLVSLHKFNRKYEIIKMALKGYYGVEKALEKNKDKAQQVFDDIIKQVLKEDINLDKEESDIIKENAKDKSIPKETLDTVIDYLQKLASLKK
jgi:Leucine-rich repeat (LRR) protein